MRLNNPVAYVSILPGTAPTPLPGLPSPDGSASDAPPEVSYRTPNSSRCPGVTSRRVPFSRFHVSHSN
eukprot:1721732-Rhodomonas_salina.1